MKILIAETDPNIRYGLTILSEQVADRIITDEATNSQELLGCVCASCPDVLLISRVFPGFDEGNILVDLQRICPSLIIIVMTVNLPGKVIEMPAHIESNIEVIQKPEQLFDLLKRIQGAHQPGNIEKK